MNNIPFFVPLSSPKDKSGSNQVTLKIKDNTEELGTLKFNNMIPVPKSELISLDPSKVRSTEDRKYGDLLLKQYFFIRSEVDRIETTAEKVYKNRTTKDIPYFNHICCDFTKLEDEYTNYIQEQARVRAKKIRSIER